MDAPLERALAALDGGDLPGARAALVEAWRQARSPAVADAVGALDARGHDELRRRLDEAITPRVTSTLERLAPLLELDDPRVSAFCIEALARLPFTTPGAQPLLLALLDAVARRGDARLLRRAPEIREGLRTRLTRLAVRDALLTRFDAVVASLAARPPHQPSALERHLEERLAPLRAPARDAASLLAAVYAAPEADGPRQVYADWLLERGDVRGEFISLQFKRHRGEQTPADEAHEAALLKKHGRTWLGPLAPVCSFGKSYSRTAFERGFLATADIMLSVGKKLEPLWAAREWATVEELDGSWPLELLERAPLAGLQRLDRILSVETLERLRALSPRLPVREATVDANPASWAAAKRAFPRLDTLRIWLQLVPTLEQLERLSGLGLTRLQVNLAWNSPSAATNDAALPALLKALATTPLAFESLAIHRYDRRGATPIELRRTATGLA